MFVGATKITFNFSSSWALLWLLNRLPSNIYATFTHNHFGVAIFI